MLGKVLRDPVLGKYLEIQLVLGKYPEIQLVLGKVPGDPVLAIVIIWFFRNIQNTYSLV